MKQIFSLTLKLDLELMPLVLSSFEKACDYLKLDSIVKAEILMIVEEIASNVVKHSQLSSEENFNLKFSEIPDGFEIVVEEKGVPFVISNFDLKAKDFIENPERKGLGLYIVKQLADEVKFLLDGKNGKKTIVRKYVQHKRIDNYKLEKKEVNLGDFAELKFLDSTRAIAVSEIIWKVYGYSYLWDVVYYPEKLKKYMDDKKLEVLAGVDKNENIGSCCAIVKHEEFIKWIEIAMAVVDKSWRGQGLLEKMTLILLDKAKKQGFKAAFVQAVTNHPLSQKAALKNGFIPVCLSLGYLPEYMDFDKSNKLNKRYAVIDMVRLLEESETKSIYIPFEYAQIVERIVDKLGVKRSINYSESDFMQEEKQLLARSSFKDEQKIGYIRIFNMSSQLINFITERVEQLKKWDSKVIYVDVNIEEEAAGTFLAWLKNLGFVFAGFMPSYLEGKDTIRMQLLNSNDIEIEKLEVLDLGVEILEFIKQEI